MAKNPRGVPTQTSSSASAPIRARHPGGRDGHGEHHPRRAQRPGDLAGGPGRGPGGDAVIDHHRDPPVQRLVDGLAPQVPQRGGKPPPGLITIGENHDHPFMTSFPATGPVPPRTMITFGSVADGGPGRARGRYRPGGCGQGGVLPASGTAASVLAPCGPALRDAGGRAGVSRPDIGECIGPNRARSRHFTCRSRWPAGTCGTPGTTPASHARGPGRAPGGVIAG